MVKNKKTTKQAILDITSGKSKPSAWSIRPPTLLNIYSGNNNNINNNNGNKINNNHNTKKKKTPAAAKSTLNAINRAGNLSKTQKRSRT